MAASREHGIAVAAPPAIEASIAGLTGFAEDMEALGLTPSLETARDPEHRAGRTDARELEPGSRILEIERTSFTAAGPIDYERLLYCSDRPTFQMRSNVITSHGVVAPHRPHRARTPMRVFTASPRGALLLLQSDSAHAATLR